jgi:hypothetical protein
VSVKPNLTSQLHLRFVLPLLGVAAAGLAVMQLGLVDRLTGDDESAQAAQPVVTQAVPEPSPTPPANEPATEAQESDPASNPEPKSSKPSGADRLAAELESHRWVVVLLYAPEGQVDALATAEARLAADEVHAGFVAIDSSKERAVSDLALDYDLRMTPTVLVVTRGPTLANKIEGFADRETVAQLIEDARRAA